MHDVQFMVLTGHLSDYPLPSLIKTLYGQRKSGRLQVEYAESPGAFYFEHGKLVDAQLGDLRGLEALLLALSLPGASFNFNPLIKAPERSFPERAQNFIRDLLEAGTREALNTPAVGHADTIPLQIVYADESAPVTAATERPALPPAVEEILVSEVRALLAAHSRRFSRERAAYTAVIGVLILLVFGIRFFERPPGSTLSADKSGSPQTVSDSAPGKTSPATDSTESSTTAPHAESPDAVSTETRAPVNTAIAPPAKLAERPARKRRGRNTTQARENTRITPGATEAGSAASRDEMVSVVMQVAGGRVVQAKVQNSRPGMASYEALALRMARQRRYPEGFSGQDTFQLRVKQ